MEKNLLLLTLGNAVLGDFYKQLIPPPPKIDIEKC